MAGLLLWAQRVLTAGATAANTGSAVFTAEAEDRLVDVYIGLMLTSGQGLLPHCCNSPKTRACGWLNSWLLMETLA